MGWSLVKVGNLLVPGNHEPWAEVRDTLNKSLLGWSNYYGERGLLRLERLPSTAPSCASP
jgi:hypothetical protein